MSSAPPTLYSTSAESPFAGNKSPSPSVIPIGSTNRLGKRLMRLTTGLTISIAIGLLTLATIACGAESTPISTSAPTLTPLPSPSPTSPTDDDTNGDMAEVLAPIDNLEINIAESFPPQVFLNIQSGLPNGCVEFSRYELERDGTSIRVTVWNLGTNRPQHSLH